MTDHLSKGPFSRCFAIWQWVKLSASKPKMDVQTLTVYTIYHPNVTGKNLKNRKSLGSQVAKFSCIRQVHTWFTNKLMLMTHACIHIYISYEISASNTLTIFTISIFWGASFIIPWTLRNCRRTSMCRNYQGTCDLHMICFLPLGKGHPSLFTFTVLPVGFRFESFSHAGGSGSGGSGIITTITIGFIL